MRQSRKSPVLPVAAQGRSKSFRLLPASQMALQDFPADRVPAIAQLEEPEESVAPPGREPGFIQTDRSQSTTCIHQHRLDVSVLIALSMCAKLSWGSTINSRRRRGLRRAIVSDHRRIHQCVDILSKPTPDQPAHPSTCALQN